MITDLMFGKASKAFNLPVPLIKAVAEIESAGNGMQEDGRPEILFEPHIFWQQLQRRGVRPKDHQKGNEDILYPEWKSGAYGTYSQQHERLERAAKIDREAALASASWGKFQIMGFNWRLAGSAGLQDFVNSMYEGEEAHLTLFLSFLKATKLDRALRARDWRGFAFGYNGKSYAKNNYHVKLQRAYEKHLKTKFPNTL
jgi:N-acetylmuramidase